MICKKLPKGNLPLGNFLYFIMLYSSSSLLSATTCGPLTLSFRLRPFLISMFTPSLKPVVTCLRS